MLKHLLFPVSLCMTTGGAAGQSDDAAVAAATESLRLAMISPDRAALEALAAATLTYGHSSGRVESREEFMEAFLSGKNGFTSITLSDQTVVLDGDTALVRHRLVAHTNDAGKPPGVVSLKILLVWKKHGARWQLLARQAVKFAG